MSIWIELNEGTAARRRVPCRIFTSNGTAPDTGALDDAVIMGTNSLGTFSLSSTLRAVNANQGMYCIELSQSECSVLGTHPLYHTVGDFPQHIATVQIVNHNHFSTLSAISNVTIHAGTHSSVTIQGLSNYANISNVTLHAGTHSGVTVQGVTQLAALGQRSIASSYLSSDLGNARLVQDAYFALRNRVHIDGSRMTVYHPDDSTSAWTATVTTGGDPITQIDPGGVA
jgi:hypothetical protein